MMANPSHLEGIDSAIVGRVRAEQVEKNDTKCTYRIQKTVLNLKLEVHLFQLAKSLSPFWFTAMLPSLDKVLSMKPCI